MPRTYSRDFLLSGFVRDRKISRSLRRKLFYFGILQKLNFDRPITVRVTQRRLSSSTPSRRRFLSKVARAPRHSRRPGRSLSFGLLNIRSLHRKVDDVLDLLEDRSLDVMLLTETWHDSDSVCINQLRSRGLIVTEQPRPRPNTDSISINHGGVLIMSTARVRQTRLHFGSNHKTFEAVCVRLTSGASSCVIILIYRTGAISTLFFSELSNLLEHFSTYACPLILAGDLNFHVERSDDPHTRTLLDMLDSHSLVCRVHSPTHDLGGTLDVVFTRSDLPPISVVVSDPGLSDHHLLSWSVPFTLPPPRYISVSYRPWSRLNIVEFRRVLTGSSLCQLSSWQGLDADQLAVLYDSTITSALDSLIPVRTAKLRRRPSDPWFDDVCREAKRSARSFERRLRRLKRRNASASVNSAAIDSAVLACKRKFLFYRSLLRRKRELFWRAKINSCTSSRDLWQSFDSLMGRGRSPTPDCLSASTFHDFFDHKVSSIRDATAGSSPPSFEPAPPECKFDSFFYVTFHSVARAIANLPTKSSVRDPLPTSLLKECADLLVPFVTHLFNVSLSSGVFPNPWKHACVTPLLKKGKQNPSDVKAYRPISHLPALSKLLEKLTAAQLRSYLQANNLFPSCQSAYRPHHSTETAMLKITSDILLALDKGNVCLLCSLDLSAAFDTVEHSILLSRLRNTFSISGTALKWLASFLSERTQSVLYGATSSPSKPSNTGVPQGSVLGPLLFILFSSDLTSLIQSHDLKTHMYADDILVYGSCIPSKRTELSETLSVCLDDLISWFSSNRLLLNIEKSEFMWCVTKRRGRNLAFAPARFGRLLLPSAASMKCLGVVMNNDISFSSYISKTVSACFAVLRQIRSVRSCLPQPLLASFVTALVLPRLDYCVSLLSGTPSAQLQRLQAVLHASARLIYGSKRFCSVSPLLKELRWLPIQERIDFRLAALAFNCQRGAAPDYLRSELTSVSSHPGRSSLRSGASSALLTPFVRCPTIGGRSFKITAARVWNSLPPSFRSDLTFVTFKRVLKAHFLRRL